MTHADARLDYLAYVRKRLRDRKSEDPISDAAADPARYAKPLWHPTSASRLIDGTAKTRRVKEGDRIWLLQLVEIGGVALPPALDGVVEVGSVLPMAEIPADLRGRSSEKDKSHGFLATELSFWCPWVGAERDFTGLEFETANGPGQPLPSSQDGTWRHWGQRLQAPRRLSTRDVARLERLSRRVLSRPRAFVSFAWNDGAAYAGMMAKLLSQRGFSVWLDQFNMPRRIGNGSILASRPDMGAHLQDCVRGSAAFVQLATRRATGCSEWCARELEAAERQKERDPKFVLATIDLASWQKGMSVGCDVKQGLERLATDVARAAGLEEG